MIQASMLLGQTDIAFHKDFFRNDKAGLKNALYHLEGGDFYYEKKDYNLSLQFYQKAHSFNPNNSYVNYQIALCYLNTGQRSLSLPYIKKARQLNPAISTDINYYTGYSFQVNYAFDSALHYYALYKQTPSIDSLLLIQCDKREKECKFAKKEIQQAPMVEVQNLGDSINSSLPEYRPFMIDSMNKLYYTAIREKKNSNNILLIDEDIIILEHSNNEWVKEIGETSILNTTTDDALAGISADYKQLIFYNGKIQSGDIYTRKYYNNQWSKPQYLPNPVNSTYNESTAFISITGDTIYFVSNRPDQSMGGKDIYFSVKGKNNTWSTPGNLGANINTELDEEGVFYDYSTHRLYFSSQGHSSIGGYDIFYTCRDTVKNDWCNPVNIGIPINSPEDDYFFILSPDGAFAYMSSNRAGGLGFDDIYRINYEKTLDYTVDISDPLDISPDTTSILPSLQYISKETPNNIESSYEVKIKISEKSNTDAIITRFPKNKKGEVTLSLPPGEEYGIHVRVE